MLFFGVFLHESARTAAKSGTNLNTNSGKATKRLGRLAPNLAHMCKLIWEWIYAKQIAPRETRGGHLGGLRWSTIQKSGEAVRLAPTLVQVCGFNGHRLNTSRPSIPQGAFRGGVRVSQIQKSWEAIKRLDRLAPNLVHICRSIWEWIYAKQVAPRDTRGHLGGF